MSTVVSVLVDGKEKIYFRIVEHDSKMFIERPESASIRADEIQASDSLQSQVTAALEAIQREDEKWERTKSRQTKSLSSDLSF